MRKSTEKAGETFGDGKVEMKTARMIRRYKRREQDPCQNRLRSLCASLARWLGLGAVWRGA